MDERSDPDPQEEREAPKRRQQGGDRIVIGDDFDDPLPELDAWEDSPILPDDEPEPAG